MATPNDNLRAILEAKNEEFKGTPYPFAMSGMSMAGYMSSRRSTMFTSNLSQLKSPTNPEIPRVFTNFENFVGKYSTGYKRADSNYEVYDKICKFDDETIPDKYNNYFLVLYDAKKNHYRIERRSTVKKLTENFGFRYNTDFIDSLKPGDKVKKNDILYKSNSYDEHMNYRYGMNLTVVHSLNPHLIEDAILISESAAKAFSTISVGTPETSVNDNDILINLYGNKDEYRPFPDIGEMVINNIILSKKRLHNNRILYDMKKSELRKISFMNNKILYGSGRVIDIDIYCNKEIDDIEDNGFNAQVLKYLKMQKRFYTHLYNCLKSIIESDATYTRDISYWYRRASQYINPEYKFKDKEGNVFSNYKIIFTLEKVNHIETGQKMVGRYGNKGVVSLVVPDENMPVLSNGVIVDLQLNSLGPTNRLISAPLYEVSLNFIGDRLVEYIQKEYADNRNKKEALLFDVYSIIAPEQCKKLREYYYKLDEMAKERFFMDLEEYGTYIEVPVLWEERTLYDKIDEVYDKYPEVFKPYDVYIKEHGVYHKMMGKYTGYVGQMYMLNLKQTSQKDFSTRSTAAINSRELPAKSDSAKRHQDIYPKTPIKLGYQEIINLLITIKSRIIAEITMLYRSSVKGRRKLGDDLLTKKKTLKRIKNIEQYVSRNVEILNAKFKVLGLGLKFNSDLMYVEAFDKKIKTFRTKNNGLFIGTTNEYINHAIREKLEERYKQDICIVTSNAGYEEMLLKDIMEIRKRK